MANDWQKAGPNHVPSYITSGIILFGYFYLYCFVYIFWIYITLSTLLGTHTPPDFFISLNITSGKSTDRRLDSI